jgi:glycosyltransferase involved in cell wall biosynthesis
MRVVLWNDGYLRTRGGAEQVVHMLAAALSDGGTEVHVIAAPPTGASCGRVPPPGVRVHHGISGHPLRRAPHPFAMIADTAAYFAEWLRVTRVLWKIRPDVVHVHYVGLDSLPLVVLGRWLRYRSVLTFTGGDVVIAETRYAGRWRIRLAVRWSDAATAVSHDLASRLGSVSGRSVRCIPNGVDAPAPPPGTPAKHGETRFVSVGRLVPVKGVPWLVRAFGRCLDRGCNAHLLIVGEGEDADEIRRVVDELGQSDRIRLLGGLPHDEVLRVVAGSHCLVAASESEGLPMVMLEAMALGRPVIASNVGGVPEIVADGVNGWLFPPRDAERFCELAMAVARDSVMATRAGERGREFVRARYSTESMVSGYLDLYRRVTGASDRADRG